MIRLRVQRLSSGRYKVLPVARPKVGTTAKQPSSDRRASHHCHAKGCVTACKPEYLMCPRHWRMVPRLLQVAVWQTYRRGQCDDMRPSEAWFLAANAAIANVARQERQ